MHRLSPIIGLMWLLMIAAAPAAAQTPTPAPYSGAPAGASATAMPADSSQPTLAVTSPAEGQNLPASTLTMTFLVTNFQIVPSTVPLGEAGMHPDLNRAGQGHLHLMLDLQPLIVWDQNQPYVFSNLPVGTHQLMVELANNDHSSLNPRVAQTIQFSVQAPLTMPVTGTAGPAVPAGAAVPAVGIGLLAAGVWLHRLRGRPR
jgi:hypothetical protein